jgi:hypothetical protein
MIIQQTIHQHYLCTHTFLMHPYITYAPIHYLCTQYTLTARTSNRLLIHYIISHHYLLLLQPLPLPLLEILLIMHIATLRMLQHKINHFQMFTLIQLHQKAIIYFPRQFNMHQFIIKMVNYRQRFSRTHVLLVPPPSHLIQLLPTPRPNRTLQINPYLHRSAHIVLVRSVQPLYAYGLTPINIPGQIVPDGILR